MKDADRTIGNAVQTKIKTISHNSKKKKKIKLEEQLGH